MIWMLISGIIADTILSIIFGEIQWGAIIGLLNGIFISESYREQEGVDDVETDARVEGNIRKFMVFTFILSNLLLLIYLFVREYVFHQDILAPIYLILYLLITLFVALLLDRIL